MKEILTYALFIIPIVLSLAWYIPYYNQRLVNYNKHRFVLENQCYTNTLHPEIQHNDMTHAGISTNCSRAHAFTSVWPCIGAVEDMWTSSPIYSIIWASAWQTQIILGLAFLISTFLIIREFSRAIVQTNFLNSLKEKKSPKENLVKDKKRKERKDELIFNETILDKTPPKSGLFSYMAMSDKNESPILY